MPFASPCFVRCGHFSSHNPEEAFVVLQLRIKDGALFAEIINPDNILQDLVLGQRRVHIRELAEESLVELTAVLILIDRRIVDA